MRPAAVAGTFYAGNADELATVVDSLLERARLRASKGAVDPAPVALVAPHAGFVYSGPVAASAYDLLRDRPVGRVAVLGPAHYVPLNGIAVPAAAAFATPIGEVPVEVHTCAALAARHECVTGAGCRRVGHPGRRRRPAAGRQYGPVPLPRPGECATTSSTYGCCTWALLRTLSETRCGWSAMARSCSWHRWGPRGQLTGSRAQRPVRECKAFAYFDKDAIGSSGYTDERARTKRSSSCRASSIVGSTPRS